jgi:hypothetical protein
MVDELSRRADEFDVIHCHIDLFHFPLVRDFADSTLTTLHDRLDLPDLKPFYAAFPEIPLVLISDSHRRPMPAVNWAAMVPHALPRELLPFSPQPEGDYLAFLGRSSPESDPIAPSRSRPVPACRSRSPPRWTRSTALLGHGHRASSPDTTTSSSSARSASLQRRPPRECPGAALPDRLARAVRPGDDRGNGLRYARHRLELRRRARVVHDGVTASRTRRRQ